MTTPTRTVCAVHIPWNTSWSTDDELVETVVRGQFANFGADWDGPNAYTEHQGTDYDAETGEAHRVVMRRYVGHLIDTEA